MSGYHFSDENLARAGVDIVLDEEKYWVATFAGYDQICVSSKCRSEAIILLLTDARHHILDLVHELEQLSVRR